MKIIRHIAVVCLLGLSLSACSYFDTEANLDNESGKQEASETIDLTKNDGGVPEVETQVIQPPQSVSDIVRNSTGGSVDVMPLDGPAYHSQPAPQQQAYSYVDNVGAPETLYSGDPSVEIYSLDGPVFSPSNNDITPMPADMQVPPINVVHSSNGSVAVVYFEHGETKLNAAAKAEVERFTVVRNVAATGLSVEGHASTQSSLTDPVKRKMANLKVSMDRALSVARELVYRGVPADNIVTVAHGEAGAGQNDDQSRRVEIRAVSGH